MHVSARLQTQGCPDNVCSWMSSTHRSADSHAVQRVKTEKNLRALLGPAAAEAAQEQQRAANRAVKASALRPGFALDERWRSTPCRQRSEPGFSQPSSGKHAWPPTRPHPWDCTSRPWRRRRWPQRHRPRTCKLFAFSLGGGPDRQYHHDWTAPIWDQTLAEYLEWSYDQGTTQDMASKKLAAVRWALPNLPQPVSRSFPSAIACLQAWKRLEPGSLPPMPAPRVLVLLVARWLAERNQKNFRVSNFCLLFETYMRPSEGLALRGFQPSADQRNSWSRGQVGHYSSERASWGSLAKQASTTRACRWTWHANSSCFPYCRCSKERRGARQLLFPFSYTQVAPENGWTH